jgi:hypothetical protein
VKGLEENKKGVKESVGSRNGEKVNNNVENRKKMMPVM